MTFDYGYSVIADYTANRKYTTNPKTGRREEHAQLISSELPEEISARLSSMKGQKYMEAEWITQPMMRL